MGNVIWGFMVWGFLGWITGILTMMQVQVLRMRRKQGHPTWTNPNFIPMEERLEPKVDWDAAAKTELADDIAKIVSRTLTPTTPVMEECAVCGKQFKRVSQHIRIKHPEVVAPPSDLQVVPEFGADGDSGSDG